MLHATTMLSPNAWPLAINSGLSAPGFNQTPAVIDSCSDLLVEVSRARAMIADKGAHVFDRLLTTAEAEYCRSRPDPAEHVAVRLAAKEEIGRASCRERV